MLVRQNPHRTILKDNPRELIEWLKQGSSLAEIARHIGSSEATVWRVLSVLPEYKEFQSEKERAAEALDLEIGDRWAKGESARSIAKSIRRHVRTVERRLKQPKLAKYNQQRKANLTIILDTEGCPSSQTTSRSTLMGYGKIRQSLKTGMGGSRCGKGRTEGTETMKEYSDKLRREESKHIIREQMSEMDAENLATARVRAATQRAVHPVATNVSYDPSSGIITVLMSDESLLTFSAHHLKGLSDASPDLIAEVEITPSGLGLHWEKLDVDLSLSTLLQF